MRDARVDAEEARRGLDRLGAPSVERGGIGDRRRERAARLVEREIGGIGHDQNDGP